MEAFKVKTKQLSFAQKLGYVYWLIPNSWLLDEFSFDGKTISIIRKNGHIFNADIKDIETKFVEDNFGKAFTIKSKNGGKTRFREIPWMLSEKEWETILSIIEAKESIWSKVVNTVKDVADEVKG